MSATNGPGTAQPRSDKALFYVPGYKPEHGQSGGVPLTRDPALTANLPRNYDGPLTLVTRLDETDRSVRRALMPLGGHHVAIDPRGERAFFSSLDREQMVLFDPRSLALLGTIAPHAPGFVGGGHASWTRDGRYLVGPSADLMRASPDRRPTIAGAWSSATAGRSRCSKATRATASRRMISR